MSDREPLKALLEEALPSAVPSAAVERRVLVNITATGTRQQKADYAVAIWPRGLVAAAFLVGALLWWVMPAGTSGGSAVAAQEITVDGRISRLYALKDGSRILARPQTEALVTFGESESVVLLEHGSVVVHAKPQLGRKFATQLGDLRVVVVGTVFEVSRNDQGERVSVLEGQVRVEDGNENHVVTAGQSYPRAAKPSVTSNELRLLQAQVAGLGGAAVPTVELGDDGRLGADAGSAASVTPSPSLPAGSASSNVPGAEFTGTAGAAAGGVDVDVDGTAESDLQRAETQFSRAKALEGAGDLRAAYALYESLAWSANKHAADGLYAAGRLSLELGELSRAQRLFGAYESKFGGGSYARAVDVHQLRLAVRSGDDAAVLDESERFLRNHANDPRAAQFAMAKARVLSRRGDCAGALALVVKIQTSEAEQLRSVCDVSAPATTISPNLQRKNK